ncbi:30S ribosomal protein S6 [bacterium]|nr:30S ribosomal protein S6 [bacterium]
MYEVIAIMNPNVTSEFVEGKISDWTAIIKEYGAELSRVDRWGKKNLAYEVKKFHQGYFLLFHIEGNPDVIGELERRFRIADEVIRYQSVKLVGQELVQSVELLDQMNARVREEKERREARELAVSQEKIESENEVK